MPSAAEGNAVLPQSNGVERAPSVTLRKAIGRTNDSIFRFAPGDLGTRRFEAERLEIEDGALVMARNGRRMRYVRH